MKYLRDVTTPNVGLPAPEDIFSDNLRWGDLQEWRQAAVQLHDKGPMHWIEREGFTPFWAVIGHAALLEIETRSDVFKNEPEAVLGSDEAFAERTMEIKTLIHMDEPQHGDYRRLTASWFKPSSLSRMEARLEQLSHEALATMADSGGELDFAVDVAMRYPLQVILAILGLPEEDYARMLTLTQELFGAEDPDLQRSDAGMEAIMEVLMDFYAYFTDLTGKRRETPTDDLASLIANGQIGGEPMPDLETMGYYVIVATAGHDTTSNAMSGGMAALIDNPDQLKLLQDDPDLLNGAIEEMIRWTTPVRHFMRTAIEDITIEGQDIKKGDWLLLSYPAANLDPKVFEDPLEFRIDRSSDARHVAFGWGIHFCLGSQLARMELRSLFSAIIPRLKSIELAGEPTVMKSTFVGGHKTLPIRFELTED